jgi:large subunit ribosomal protein L21e
MVKGIYICLYQQLSYLVGSSLPDNPTTLVYMSQRSHGLFVGRTRQLARHHRPSRLGLTTLIKDFKINDRVIIIQKGNFKNIPHPRYRGRVGTVIEKRGDAYVVRVNTSKSLTRSIIVPQMHLEKA